jgi:ribosome-binding protein aMBF1 (putative translation factor)
MARCVVCGKMEEQVQLFDGVYDGRISKVCFNCSGREGITLIKKPTQEQLAEAQRRHSVRELMDKMSSPQKKIMPRDQMMAHKNLAKLKFPGMKQEHGDLVQNYDWVLKQARRHAKLSIGQVSEKIHFDKAQIESLESGQLFAGFEKVAYALENLYDIKILKHIENPTKLIKHDRNIPVNQQAQTQSIESKPTTKEEQILNSVREKMKRHSFLVKNKSLEQIENEIENEVTETKHEIIDLDYLREQKKQEQEEKIKKQEKLSEELGSEKFDFSKRENLDKIRIQDLSELRKLRQARKEQED